MTVQVDGMKNKRLLRAKKISQGLMDGKTYTQIAEDMGTTRQALYADMKHGDVQALIVAEIHQLETTLQEWITEDRLSPNPNLRKGATVELGKLVRHMKDKAYPTILQHQNLNINIDLTQHQKYQHLVTETLNRLPPTTRQQFWNTYNKIKQEQQT